MFTMLPKLKIENVKSFSFGVKYYPTSTKNHYRKIPIETRYEERGFIESIISPCLKLQYYSTIDDRELFYFHLGANIRIPNTDYKNYWVKPRLNINIFYKVKRRKRRIKKKCCDITVCYAKRIKKEA